MTPITESDLHPWNDPDDLLRALGRLRPEQKEELSEAVARLLDHEDADVREEAMRVLFVSWKDRRRREHAVAALRSEAVPEVRSVAPYAVAATASDATLAHDIGLLIGVLDDEEEEPVVRGAAYDALLILKRRPDFPTKRQQFDPQRDVDWEWVRSLERGSNA